MRLKYLLNWGWRVLLEMADTPGLKKIKCWFHSPSSLVSQDSVTIQFYGSYMGQKKCLVMKYCE